MLNDTPFCSKRQCWLWVARPEYYLDEDGRDREDLDPSIAEDADGWWTCHKDTEEGDLAFLWRTRPKSDIGYLIQAKSDAYSIVDKEVAREHDWTYGCNYRVLYKFAHPVIIEDLHATPHLHGWGAYRGSFQGRVFRIPRPHWERLNELATAKNRGYAAFLVRVEGTPVGPGHIREEDIEEALAGDLDKLRPHGWHLELKGRQTVCIGSGGRIDLLCYDRKRKAYLVIELKNVRAGRNTFGQISEYMGWVQERRIGKVPVLGLVISRGCDNAFQAALRTNPHISYLDVQALGF